MLFSFYSFFCWHSLFYEYFLRIFSTIGTSHGSRTRIRVGKLWKNACPPICTTQMEHVFPIYCLRHTFFHFCCWKSLRILLWRNLFLEQILSLFLALFLTSDPNKLIAQKNTLVYTVCSEQGWSSSIYYTSENTKLIHPFHPVSVVGIGAIHKRDITKIFIMNEKGKPDVTLGCWKGKRDASTSPQTNGILITLQ